MKLATLVVIAAAAVAGVQADAHVFGDDAAFASRELLATCGGAKCNRKQICMDDVCVKKPKCNAKKPCAEGFYCKIKKGKKGGRCEAGEDKPKAPKCNAKNPCAEGFYCKIKEGKKGGRCEAGEDPNAPADPAPGDVDCTCPFEVNLSDFMTCMSGVSAECCGKLEVMADHPCSGRWLQAPEIMPYKQFVDPVISGCKIKASQICM